MTILLSLICPVYKARDYLPALVESLVVGCRSPAIQIIFVNDCSPDDSMAVCRAEVARYGDAVLFKPTFIERSRNGGTAAARNTGIVEALGNYIGFIDSDDLVSPDYYAALSPLLLEGKHDIIEFGFDEFTDKPSEYDATDGRVIVAKQDSPYLNGFFAWSRVYKAEIVRAVPFLEGRIYEDVRFVAEVFGKTRAIAKVATPLVHYRRRTGSITASRDRRYAEQLISLIEGTTAALPTHADPARIVTLTARKSIVILLKGIRIKASNERQAFFDACRAPLGQLIQLLHDHRNPWTATSYRIMSEVLVHSFATTRSL